MGRRKKIVVDETSTSPIINEPIVNDYHNFYTNGTKLICPVCGKEFKVNDDTKYVAKGGYTCSWKCFLEIDKRKTEVKRIKLK